MNSYHTIKSPVGDLLLAATPSALIGIYFVGRDHIPAVYKDWKLDSRPPILRQTAEQLKEYFAGKRTDFSLPLKWKGTHFQERVWQEIARIPYGETITYGELAGRVGNPAAVRAAGTSTGRNPISIIVPCHRVMGKDGKITGYAGGLEKKRFLLELENPNAKLL